MAFTITIDRDRAIEILTVAKFCYSQGQCVAELSFLLKKIAVEFPDLWASYSYLQN